MVERLIEIPLPGRTVGSASAAAPRPVAEMTLPSFVAGPENHLVAGAVSRLLEAGADTSLESLASDCTDGATTAAPCILALCGESGTGKTHLARGAVRWWQEHCGPQSAEYLTAADFRRRLTDAYDADDVAEFRRQTRGRRLLAIDDLDRLPASDYVQQELRYTIDACEAAGHWLLVASHRPVGTLATLSPDVRSRLSAGLVLRLAPPGEPARNRIAQQISTALGRPLPDDAAQRLAAGVVGTANDLFGAVFELYAAAPGAGPSSADRIQRYLADHEPRRPPLREIIAVVAKYHRVPQKVLKSGLRKQAAVTARAMVAYLARELAGTSYERIGHALGGRDHTTVMHSYRKIHKQLEHDPATREAVADLRRLLLAG